MMTGIRFLPDPTAERPEFTQECEILKALRYRPFAERLSAADERQNSAYRARWSPDEGYVLMGLTSLLFIDDLPERAEF